MVRARTRLLVWIFAIMAMPELGTVFSTLSPAAVPAPYSGPGREVAGKVPPAGLPSPPEQFTFFFPSIYR
jgi:hypothetical protein